MLGLSVSAQSYYNDVDYSVNNKAGQLMKNHQYSSAIFEYKKVLRNDSNDLQAKVGLINAYLARASYYANTTKELYKASYDIKSALFYLEYFNGKELDEATDKAISQNRANLSKIQSQLKQSNSPTEKYKLAKALRIQGEFAAAAYDFIQLAQTTPTISAECYVQIGDIMNILGVFDNSINYYKLALKANPNKENVHLKLARVYEKVGKIDEAANEYTSVFENSAENSDILSSLENIWTIKVQQQPRSAEAHANLGAIYQKTGKTELALHEYQKAQNLDPSNVNTKLNLGTLYQQKKDYETALATYNSILSVYPRNEKAILYKAQCLANLDMHDEALKSYKEYLAIKPNDNLIKTEMMTLLKDKMTPQEVLDILYEDVKQNPNNPDVYYKFAYELHKANKLDDAIVYYDLAIQMNPKMLDAYINLAQTYAQKGNNTEAINTIKKAKSVIGNNEKLNDYYSSLAKGINEEIYNKATTLFSKSEYNNAINEYLKIQPQTVDSLIGIASSYQALENYPMAVEYFQKALTKEPNDTDTMYFLALAYSNMDDLANAEKILNKALSINKKDEKLKELSEYIVETQKNDKLEKAYELYENQNYEKAMAILSDVIVKNPQTAHAYFYRGLIFDAQKKYQDAINNYLNAVKYTDDLNIAYYSIGVDYDYLQNYAQAINYYKKYLSTEPAEQEYIEFVQNRIKELEPYVKK